MKIKHSAHNSVNYSINILKIKNKYKCLEVDSANSNTINKISIDNTIINALIKNAHKPETVSNQNYKYNVNTSNNTNNKKNNGNKQKNNLNNNIINY
jgi:hypothetical protein